MRRLGQAQRVLVVTPASLKTEWEEQIQRFTGLGYQLVFGGRSRRLQAYDLAGRREAEANPAGAAAPFFTIVNYEQMLADSLEVNARLRPDIVVLDAAQWRENLNSLHEEYFGPGRWDPLSPVRLEVIDRATDDALQRLIDAGLVTRTTRSSRPLWPAGAAEAAPAPLSEVERQQAAAHRQRAARKLKMARLLGEGGLEEEARNAILEAVLPLARALAVESRLPEPADAAQALLPPLSVCWQEALAPLRQFTADASAAWKPIFERLQSV